MSTENPRTLAILKRNPSHRYVAYDVLDLCRKLEQENVKLREALAFYAENVPSAQADLDAGAIAKAAIQHCEEVKETPPMGINEKQAQLLLDWMAMAGTDAADDKEQGTAWRIHRFQHQAKMLMEQFNEAAV